jgi:exopolysaccharide biosynthesis polyprenyl glycosylphosphotransferase
MSLQNPPDQAGLAATPTGPAPIEELVSKNGTPPTDAPRNSALPASPARTRPPNRRLDARGRRQPTASPEVKVQRLLFRVSDTAVVVSLLLLVFIVTNIGDMPGGIRGFLALRITVKNLLLLLAFAVVWRALSLATGLHDLAEIGDRRGEPLRVILACTLVSGMALWFPTMSVTGAFQYSAIFYFWLSSIVGILMLRHVIRAVVPRTQQGKTSDALIVGTGPRAQRLYQELVASGNTMYNVVGFVDSADRLPAHNGGGKMLGGLEDLEGILMRNAIDEVLIVLPIKSRYAEIERVLDSCDRIGVRAKFLADLFEERGCVSEVEGDRVSLVAAPRSPEGWWLVSKRVIDIVGASTGLIVLGPVLLVAALAIKLTSTGPVFFIQTRYGLNRRPFKMYKLRSMVAEADALQASLEARNEASGPVFKIHDDPRVTRVGKWLRRTSLDEFPQLLNVLRGEMSLVGPRPLPIRDVHRFTEAALMRRFSVRPGLTCLWQISGRSNLTFNDWIRLDLQYIDDWSMRLDLWILVRTFPVVLKGTGAS